MHRDLIYSTSDVGLLTEVAEAGHGHQDCLDVWAPQEHVQGHFQLGLGLAADRGPAAACSALLGNTQLPAGEHCL